MAGDRISSGDLQAQINQNGVVDKWSQYFTDRLRKSLKKNKIGKSGNLNRSIVRELKRSGGDISAVVIKFAMYGRFVDMGVGNGLKAYERGTNKAMKAGARKGANVSYNSRKPKRWYNKTGRAQLYRLRELMQQNMGEAAVYNVQDGISPDTTDYELKL